MDIMAAVLKKRALAEYSHVIKEEPGLIKPTKRLRFMKRGALTGSSVAGYAGLLDKSRSSNEALTLLLRIADALADSESEGSTPQQQEDLSDTLRKLNEHFSVEKESCVRAKILWLFGDIGSLPGQDVQGIMDDIVGLLKREESHKYLCDTSQAVKCHCLQLISRLLPLEGGKEQAQVMLRLVGHYTHYQDPRVRTAAFEAMLELHERGLKLDSSLYSEVVEALRDDYEIVRRMAMQLICVLAITYPDNILTLSGEQQIRLADDAFGKLCSCISDLSPHVRAQAARLLGRLGGGLVRAKFLQQTLDKKLMSNMRKKRSAHERQWESVTSGEWASGKKWADDAPRELVDADAVSLISSGACGAFVHGLEDEFMEVRSVSVDALCSLALSDAHFAKLSLDFLVDMFNDEIEEVRLKAIDSLTRISSHIVLREDQLETILGALEDCSIDVREGLHKMLGASRLATKGCLQMCVDKLLENLKKYPEDKRSMWACAQRLGSSHPQLVLPLVPALLSSHPFLDLSEPDVEDPAYVCILILVFNAAQRCPNMLQLFEEHILKHYGYVRDTMPALVPHLKELCAATTHTDHFVTTLLDRLEMAQTPRLRAELLNSAQTALARLADMDECLSGAAHFTSRFIKCHMLLNKMLSNKVWASPSALASHEGICIKSGITELLQICLRLQHVFVGHNDCVTNAVRQLKLRALALQLLYTVHGSNASALALCEHFLNELDALQRYCFHKSLPVETFTSAVMRDLALLEDPKPGAVARVLLPLISIPPGPLPRAPNTADSALSFTAGLVLGVPLDAELSNLSNVAALRVKVKYPDQTTQLLVPCRSDLRVSEIKSGTEQRGFQDYRLRTTVLMSHGVWTEACQVDLSLALDLTASEASLGRRGEDNLCVLDLCKPVTISISPKPVKRGI
ncbi:hypothetical protein B566_EDAN011617 [Ephemera danica]|nr:hypothetical protein B566_EDAN011617 [Ephemera danica]